MITSAVTVFMFKNSVWYIGLYFVINCGNMAWYRYWFWFLKTVQNNGFFEHFTAVFTTRCYEERGIAMESHLSVHMSVMLRSRDHICRNTSKVISLLVFRTVMTDANWCSLFTDPQHHGSTPKGTPLNFRHNRGGVLKKLHKSSISEMR